MDKITRTKARYNVTSSSPSISSFLPPLVHLPPSHLSISANGITETKNARSFPTRKQPPIRQNIAKILAWHNSFRIGGKKINSPLLDFSAPCADLHAHDKRTVRHRIVCLCVSKPRIRATMQDDNGICGLACGLRPDAGKRYCSTVYGAQGCKAMHWSRRVCRCS